MPRPYLTAIVRVERAAETLGRSLSRLVARSARPRSRLRLRPEWTRVSRLDWKLRAIWHVPASYFVPLFSPRLRLSPLGLAPVRSGCTAACIVPPREPAQTKQRHATCYLVPRMSWGSSWARRGGTRCAQYTLDPVPRTLDPGPRTRRPERRAGYRSAQAMAVPWGAKSTGLYGLSCSERRGRRAPVGVSRYTTRRVHRLVAAFQRRRRFR